MNTASQKAVSGRAIAIGIAQAALWGVLGSTVMGAIPQFQKVFTDFGVDLPGVTRLVIVVSSLLYSYWYLAILAAVLLNWGVVSLLWSNPEAVVARRAWYVATWLAPVALLAFVMIALLVPLVSLVTVLS
jgi:hypothetical protein